MRNSKCISTPLSTLFAAAALVSNAAAADATRAPLEFNMKLRFDETIVFTGASPCFALGSLSARGWATHLGEVTAQAQDCINPKGVFDPGAPASNSFAFYSHPVPLRLTVQNGDQIFMVYSGTLSAQDGRPHGIRGHFVITGGTGRFALATGGGKLTGYEDITQVVSGRGAVAASGTISF